MPIIDPTTEEVTTEVAKATIDDVDAAVKAAHRAFEDGPWSRMHHEDRAKILFRIADLIDERGEEIGLRESMDMGMPFLKGFTTWLQGLVVLWEMPW
jgi:aldehyde dehydrogenase (NAD+)